MRNEADKIDFLSGNSRPRLGKSNFDTPIEIHLDYLLKIKHHLGQFNFQES